MPDRDDYKGYTYKKKKNFGVERYLLFPSSQVIGFENASMVSHLEGWV